MASVPETPQPRFSLIIPAYNEEALLPGLLDTVDAARQRYTGGADAVEVIVADNASTDQTAEIARSRGCCVVFVEKRAIAAARNGGASIAQGQFVAFVDADSKIHAETFNAIDEAMATQKYAGGSTGVKMERMSPGIALAYMCLIPLVWVTGLDTGVVFCRREDFEAIGGYNEARIFAEDLEFMFTLKRLGRSRRQKMVRLKTIKAITSTRKWDKHGEWHYLRLLLVGGFTLLFRPNASARWARSYWYDDPR